MHLDVPSLFRSDFERVETGSREFRVTSMSTDLANAIAMHVSASDRPILAAFDVGTGSGLHAAACVASGINDVLAIDISAEAIMFAERRFKRLQGELGRIGRRTVAAPEFICADFASSPWKTRRFSLMMANPPSFFLGNMEHEDKSPLWYALYDGLKAYASNPKNSFLYRFFDIAVRNSLEPGGTVFCMWPGIERRLTSCAEHGRMVHPAELLKQWFGWRIDGNNLAPESFYLRQASVNGYGAGNGFVREVLGDISAGTYYSDTLQPIPAGNGFSFRYGVFCMERVVGDHFRFVPIG